MIRECIQADEPETASGSTGILPAGI